MNENCWSHISWQSRFQVSSLEIFQATLLNPPPHHWMYFIAEQNFRSIYRRFTKGYWVEVSTLDKSPITSCTVQTGWNTEDLWIELKNIKMRLFGLIAKLTTGTMIKYNTYSQYDINKIPCWWDKENCILFSLTLDINVSFNILVV